MVLHFCNTQASIHFQIHEVSFEVCSGLLMKFARSYVLNVSDSYFKLGKNTRVTFIHFHSLQTELKLHDLKKKELKFKLYCFITTDPCVLYQMPYEKYCIFTFAILARVVHLKANVIFLAIISHCVCL